MAKQKALLAPGDTFTKNGEKFEVLHVSSQFDEKDNPHHYVYEIGLQSEADEKRKLNEQSAAAAAATSTPPSTDEPES